MAPESSFINSAEAAFVADISDRDFNRAIDEHILPDELVRAGTRRCVAHSAAPLVSFYFKTEPCFSAQFRKHILSTIARRLEEAEGATGLLTTHFNVLLDAQVFLFTWKEPNLKLDLSAYFERAVERWGMVEHALDQVTVDEQVLGGMPVFKDTRVPIDTILASLEAGITLERLRTSYGFLTMDLVEAAKTYARVRPRRGRPRRLAEINPKLEIMSSEVVRVPSGGK